MLALIAGLVLAMVWLAGDPAKQTPASGPSGAAEGPPVVKADPTSWPAAEASGHEGRRGPASVSVAVESVTDEATPSEAVAQAGTLVRGRIRLERDGVLETELSGSASIVHWNEDGPQSDKVDITEGRFAFDPARSVAGMRLNVARIGGEIAYSTEYARLEDNTWIIDARPIHVPMVRVIDAESGAELTDVVLHEFKRPAPFVEAGDLVHPGPIGSRAAPIFGPFDSPKPCFVDQTGEQLGYRDFIAGAPGYQWKSTRVAFFKDESYLPVIELEPAGTLELDVAGVPAGAELRLRLWRGEDLLLDWPLESDRRFAFDGLAAGSYRVTAERGSPRTRSSLGFGAVEVEIPLRGLSGAVLEVDSAAGERPPLFPVELQLDLATAWQVDSVAWGLSRVPDKTGESFSTETSQRLEPAGAGRLRGPVVPLELRSGEYVLAVRKLGLAQAFQVTGPGPIAIAFDEPVMLEVELVEELSGAPIVNGWIRWKNATEMRLERYPDYRLSLDPVSGRYVGRASVGEISITADADGYEQRRISVDLAVDRGPWRIALTSPTEFIVRYLCGGEPLNTAVPLEPPQVESIEPGGRHGSLRSARGIALSFNRPGRYRITPPPVSGFIQPEPVEIDVVIGQSGQVDFDYKRLP